MVRPAYSYRKGPSARGPKRGDPEHQFQKQVKEYLKWALPPDILWTSSMTGVNLGLQAAVKMKAAGVQRGWPDLQFLCPDGVTRYIELKVDAGLSPEQKAFRDRCRAVEAARGLRMWALARKQLESVEAALIWFGITPRCPVGKANRYDIIVPPADGE